MVGQETPNMLEKEGRVMCEPTRMWNPTQSSVQKFPELTAHY